jgi:hypothetical protein
MTPFGPYYPLVLDAVMRHAERLTNVLGPHERALCHRDPGWPWLVGRAAELRCVASVLAADWHKGRISADVAAVELAQHMRQLHRGLAEHVGIRKPGCCYVRWLAQLLVVTVAPTMAGACARGSVGESFDPGVPAEASAASLPTTARNDEFPVEASTTPVHELALDASASGASDRADGDASMPAATATAMVSIAVTSASPSDAAAAGEEAQVPDISDAAATADATLGASQDVAEAALDSPAENASFVPVASLPGIGDLIITEVMFKPSGLVPNSEWFEVLNSTDSPRLLSGLTILDGYSDPHVIASNPPVVAPAHGYVLLVRDRTAALAGGVSAACIVYEYGVVASPYAGIELGGAGGEVSLWNRNTQLAHVPYGQWTPTPLAQTIELGVLQLVGSDVASNWCLAQHPWGTGTDNGTPGGPSDCE